MEYLYNGTWYDEANLPDAAKTRQRLTEGEGRQLAPRRDLQKRESQDEKQSKVAGRTRQMTEDVKEVIDAWDSIHGNMVRAGRPQAEIDAKRVEQLVKPLQQFAQQAMDYGLKVDSLGIPPSIVASSGGFAPPAGPAAPTAAQPPSVAPGSPGMVNPGAGGVEKPTPITSPGTVVPTPKDDTWPVTGNDYTAFQKQFKKEFGRDITQDEMNSGAFLASLSNDAVRLIPIERLLTDAALVGEAGKGNSRLSQLPNEDLTGLIRKNWRIAGHLGPERLAQMDRGFLFNELFPTMDKAGERTTIDAIRAASDAVESAKTKGAGIPGNPTAGSWETPRLKIPTVDTNTDITSIFQRYTGTGGFQQPAKSGSIKLLSTGDDQDARDAADAPPTGPVGPPPGATPTPGGGGIKPGPVHAADGTYLGERVQTGTDDRGNPTYQIIPPRTQPRAPAGRQPRDQAAIDADLEQIRASRERSELARLEYEAALAKGDSAAAAQAKQLQLNYAQLAAQVERDQRTAELQAQGLDQQAAAQQAQNELQTGIATGYIDDKPTLAREAQVTGTERANMELLAGLGNQAAQLKLADLNRIEDTRRFDVNREDARRKDPASIWDKVYDTRQTATVPAGQTSAFVQPGGVQYSAQGKQGFAPSTGLNGGMDLNVFTQPGASQPSSGALTYDEIRASGAEPPAVAAATGGFQMPAYRPAGGVPIVSDQALGMLNPTERAVFDSELLATGNNPEDYYAHRRRLMGPARRSGGGFTAPRPVGAGW